MRKKRAEKGEKQSLREKIADGFEASKEIVLEYDETEVRTVSIVYCSADGVTDMQALTEWAESFDVVACGNSFLKPEVAAGESYAVCVYGGPESRFCRSRSRT